MIETSVPVRQSAVGRKIRRSAMVPAAFGLLLVGGSVFAKMAGSRADEEAFAGLPTLATSRMQPAVAPAKPRPGAPPAPFLAVREPALALAATAPAAAYLAGPPRHLFSDLVPLQQPERVRQGPGASPLIMDFFSGRSQAATAQLQPAPAGVQIGGDAGTADPTGDAIAAAAVSAGGAAARPDNTPASGNERFAARVAGKEAESVQAQRMANLNYLVPQGAIVGAVLETALDSDLPGYARASVTKNVLSFDGSQVLIPAGSRVIGEYNSGVAQGASRIFIVWTRLIRPDGVTIALGSPAVDELGRGGLDGKVNRHFLQRFGIGILTSVLTGGISALASSVGRGSTVIVGTSGEATALASQAARGTDIPPTIRTKQGALVRIFVARDLDFSGVGPAS